jgi:hypothetical protein
MSDIVKSYRPYGIKRMWADSDLRYSFLCCVGFVSVIFIPIMGFKIENYFAYWSSLIGFFVMAWTFAVQHFKKLEVLNVK